jgi:hypothetical protein
MERIDIAAIRHARHGVYSLARPNRHWQVLQAARHDGWGADVLSAEQGFITESGRFVDRKEALIIAMMAGQIEGPKFQPDMIFSEDLW